MVVITTRRWIRLVPEHQSSQTSLLEINSEIKSPRKKSWFTVHYFITFRNNMTVHSKWIIMIVNNLKFHSNAPCTCTVIKTQHVFQMRHFLVNFEAIYFCSTAFLVLKYVSIHVHTIALVNHLSGLSKSKLYIL